MENTDTKVQLPDNSINGTNWVGSGFERKKDFNVIPKFLSKLIYR